ncbi:EF hand [Ancylostoma ceylanicum]|uniref:EF hand n=1 Tax=Ancylostoma ceylanicum TaxID=53326 RepID=A0A0D6LQK6_9BILA|nr:EF hand [Ancylostoma ceylanicum]
MHRQYTNNSGSSEAEEFTQEELQEFAQAFKVNYFPSVMFDKDGNGTMNIKELGVAMRTLGMNPTEEELQNMVNEYDVDGNGKIDFGEFCKMMKEMNKETDQELIRLAFKYVFFLAQVIKRRSLEDVFMAGI